MSIVTILKYCFSKLHVITSSIQIRFQLFVFSSTLASHLIICLPFLLKVAITHLTYNVNTLIYRFRFKTASFCMLYYYATYIKIELSNTNNTIFNHTKKVLKRVYPLLKLIILINIQNAIV